MVRELFHVEPDNWQEEVLESFPHSPKIAMKASKGPGKTATLSWIGWNYLLTRPHPMCAATSISGDNLKAGLWTEMARWRNVSPLLQHLFEWTKTEIFHKEHRATWKMEARKWSRDANAEQIGQTLAGIHAPYVLFLLDESGGYPDSIMPTAEAIFSGHPIEAHIVQAGNPTQLSGPLYRACRGLGDWLVITINGDPDNPKRSKRVDIEWAKGFIKEWGRDHPYVRVNVFGEFPPHSFNALIGPDDVRASFNRFWRDYDIGDAARILGIDVALFGDDQSVIAPRHGIQMYPFKKLRNVSPPQGAGIVARMEDEWPPDPRYRVDATFIDDTGGFGATWIWQLRGLGRNPIGIPFSGEAFKKTHYFNKRTEMAFEFVDWIKGGGAMFADDPLLAQLTETTYTFKGDKMILEPKELVKARLGNSPDEMDAGMLTFAQPVAPRARSIRLPQANRQPQVYNPFAEIDRERDRPYNPFSTV